MKFRLAQRVCAEFLGTAFLLTAVVGSGIMGERLSGGNVAIALLANSIATGVALVAITLALGSISGAHLNPVVSLAERGVKWLEVPWYVAAQILGGFAGVAAAHAMFAEPIFAASGHMRAGGAQMFSEFVATFGLLSIIRGCTHARPDSIPF